MKRFFHRGRAVTIKERDVVRGASLSKEATLAGRLCERKDKLDGRGTIRSDIRLGQSRIWHSGMCPLTPPAMIHSSMVTDGAK